MLTHLIPTKSRLPAKMPACIGAPSARTDKQTGFTLLELLVVIAVTGILATVAVTAYDGVQEQSRYDATRFEMAQIREALLRFRRDSGSNDLPGQGVYDCGDLADEAIASGRPGTWPAAPNVPAVNGSNKADWITWCQHPANFWMLFVDPLGNGWDIDTKRGWNGPYLQRKSDDLIELGNDIQPSGLINNSAVSPVGNIWPLKDPAGLPYLLFDLDKKDQARIVGMSTNARYDEQDEPDCRQTLGTDGYPLDHLLCLLK